MHLLCAEGVSSNGVFGGGGLEVASIQCGELGKGRVEGSLSSGVCVKRLDDGRIV